MKTVILSARLEQARYWADQMELAPGTWIYPTEPNQLRGLDRGIRVVIVTGCEPLQLAAFTDILLDRDAKIEWTKRGH